jgi:isochorismate hydrolase
MQFTFDPQQAATVVVDMQKLFTQPDSPFQNDSSPLFGPINELTNWSRELGIPVIYSSLKFADDGKDAGLIANWPQVQDGYFATSSPWTELDPRAIVKENDHLLSRNRPSAFAGGRLSELLSSLGRTQLILTGISVNFAVAFTAHDAFSRDIPTFVVRDGVSTAPFEDSANLGLYFQTLDTWAAQVIDFKTLVEKTVART